MRYTWSYTKVRILQKSFKFEWELSYCLYVCVVLKPHWTSNREIAEWAAGLCQGDSWDLNPKQDCSLQWRLQRRQGAAGLFTGMADSVPPTSERKVSSSSQESKDVWTSSKVSWGNSQGTEMSLWRWDEGEFLAMRSDESLQLLLI